MKRCRIKRYPPRPRTLQELVDRLANPAYARNLEHDTGRLSVQLVTDTENAQHVLFYDDNFIRQEMGDVSKLLIDATFASRPQIEGVYQLLTVMGIKFSHVRNFLFYKLRFVIAFKKGFERITIYLLLVLFPLFNSYALQGFPFIWVLMSTKTQAAYTSVLQYVKEHVIPQNNIILAMTDFERALRNAITDVFTTAYCTGCNVHYDRVRIFQSWKNIVGLVWQLGRQVDPIIMQVWGKADLGKTLASLLLYFYWSKGHCKMEDV